MGKNYSLNDARNYAREFQETRSLDNIDYMKFAKSLKMFAEKSEEADFKIMINKYIELVEINGNIIYDKKFSKRKKIILRPIFRVCSTKSTVSGPVALVSTAESFSRSLLPMPWMVDATILRML